MGCLPVVFIVSMFVALIPERPHIHLKWTNDASQAVTGVGAVKGINEFEREGWQAAPGLLASPGKPEEVQLFTTKAAGQPVTEVSLTRESGWFGRPPKEKEGWKLVRWLASSEQPQGWRKWFGAGDCVGSPALLCVDDDKKPVRLQLKTEAEL
jgi:hypothetical protein